MDENDIEKKLFEAWEKTPKKQPQQLKDDSWKAFSEQAFPKRKRRSRILWTAAAVLVVSLTVGTVITFESGRNQESYAYNIVENPTMKVKLLQLPDSSVVEMEPGSQVEYHIDFTRNRKINLQGKAFFKVHKDKQHPFQVFCGKTTTTVLGTSFTVSGNSDGRVEVGLYEGRVQMNVKDNEDNWILSPGEQFVYDNKMVAVQAFSRFEDFNNAKLESVVRFIEGNYGYTVSIPEEYLNQKITLRINKKEELSNVVSLIAEMYNLKPIIDEKLKKITFY